MNLGIVGTGMISQIVVPHLKEWGCNPVAIAGTPETIRQARELCKSAEIPHAFNSYNELLDDQRIDTVYLAVPNSLHHPFAMQALEAGKHVIVEKPLCSTAREAEELSRESRARGLMLFEAITTLHLPNFHLIKRLLPHLGDIKLASTNYSQYSSRYDRFRKGEILPAFDPAKSGGAIMDLGLYNMHYLMGLFGVPRDVRYAANIERGIDTSGAATLEYGHFLAVSVAAKDCAAPACCLIEGTNGYLIQHSAANACGAITMHLNDGTEEVYDENPEMRWESEFRSIARMINERDTEACHELLDHSVAVARIITKARKTVGIVFPADAE